MKRKIVKHGKSTLTVSLPSRWIDSMGIAKGDEVDVRQSGSSLCISSAYKPKKSRIEIDLSLAGRMIPRMMAAVYVAGFDEARIHFSSPEELAMIQDTVYKYCHEYELINISNGVIEVKSIASLYPKFYEQMLRKSAQATLNIARETFAAIKKQDKKELSSLILKDKIVDRYCAFGGRIINKGFDVGITQPGPLYFVHNQTEILADIFKVISSEFIRWDGVMDLEQLELFEETIELMEKVYDLLFGFSMDKVHDLAHAETNMRERIDHVAQEPKGNMKIFAYLINLFETCFEMKSAIMVLHLGKEAERMENQKI